MPRYPGYPVDARPGGPILPTPDIAKIRTPARLTNPSDPGDYFSSKPGTVGDALGVPGLGLNDPDACIWFRSEGVYNCIEIDAEFVPVDEGWIVPEYCTLCLREAVPAGFGPLGIIPVGAKSGMLGAGRGGIGFLGWDFGNSTNRDFTCQPTILRGTTIGPYPGTISYTLPSRKIFALHGTRNFRFAMLAYWMYHRNVHNSQDVGYTPNWMYRCWYDPTRTQLSSIT